MPVHPLDLQVRVFNHRQQLLMLFLCLVKQGVKSVPHELGLLIASFLPHINTDEYKRLYQAFLEDGYILGPLIKKYTHANDFILIGGDLTVSVVGKITNVNILISYNGFRPLTFCKSKELLTLDILKDRSILFTHEGYTHKEWMKGYKSYDLHMKAFREARMIEQDKSRRTLIDLLSKQDTMQTKGGSKKSRDKLLKKIETLKKDLLALENKLRNISLYL